MSKASRIGFIVLAVVAALLGVAKLVGIVLILTGENGRDLIWVIKQVTYSGVFILGAGWCWFRAKSQSETPI